MYLEEKLLEAVLKEQSGRQWSKTRETRKLQLPEDGIYNEDEEPFHHIGCSLLHPEHIERLRECGVIYRDHVFSAEEDAIILSNWKRFSDSYGLDVRCALEFIGWRVGKTKDSLSSKRLFFQDTTRFWPKLCAGLLERSARQIYYRMGRIATVENLEKVDWNADKDSFVDSLKSLIPYKRNVAWSKEEVTRLMKLFKKCDKDFLELSRKMKRDVTDCRNKVTQILRVEESPKKEFFPVFWDIVTNSVSHLSKKLRKVVGKEEGHELEGITSLIPWDECARSMEKDVRFCKKIWTELFESLCSTFAEFNATNDVKTAWKLTLAQVVVKKSPLNWVQYARCLWIFYISAPSENFLFAKYRSKMFKNDELIDLLKSQGIFDFDKHKRESEWEYLCNRVSKLISKFSTQIFDLMWFPLTLIDKLFILNLACRRQMISLGFPDYLREHYDQVPVGSPYIDDLIEDEKAYKKRNRKQRRFERNSLYISWIEETRESKKHINCKGKPFMSKTLVIESTVIYMLDLCDDWVPPTAFKEFVESDVLLPLFTSDVNNDELRTDQLKELEASWAEED
ncbi:unnamed protein product [Caenorhabditis auriculariae]|uniref:Myb-like domain-containing protein n=1 Tax=Caenorhabditis auriculariae TaxID=2777116 RepID=A0A8S1HB62_9PELO|nr:unnamed protein product [Caenorhabditis auriculariae]